MAMKDHFFASDSDGHLYDTRNDNWSLNPPLRRDYRRTFAEIENASQLKATLRNGGFAWPGGYPLFFTMADCEPMAFQAVQDELRRVLEGMRDGERDWTPVSCDINWDSGLVCAHTGKAIESAYGADDETDESAA